MKTLLAFLVLSFGIHAATVSSITCSGQTATVNATAHGLVASQGFSLSGTAPTFNSTASTVTTNALTFILPAGTVCSGFSSGYTAISAAKQIIEMSAVANPGTGTVTVNLLYWFSSAAPNPLPCPSIGTPPVPVCPGSEWPGASAAENAAIVAGTTVEVQGQMTVAASTPLATLATQIVTQYNAMQAGFAGSLLAGKYFWNGASWQSQ